MDPDLSVNRLGPLARDVEVCWGCLQVAKPLKQPAIKIPGTVYFAGNWPGLAARPVSSGNVTSLLAPGHGLAVWDIVGHVS